MYACIQVMMSLVLYEGHNNSGTSFSKGEEKKNDRLVEEREIKEEFGCI